MVVGDVHVQHRLVDPVLRHNSILRRAVAGSAVTGSAQSPEEE
jgi:hypothetical protein